VFWPAARSADHFQPRFAADPGCDLDPFAGGVFEVFEILLEGRFVELGEELGPSGGVVATDVVDQLTFIHDGFTLQNGWSSHLRCNTGGAFSMADNPPIGTRPRIP